MNAEETPTDHSDNNKLQQTGQQLYRQHSSDLSELQLVNVSLCTNFIIGHFGCNFVAFTLLWSIFLLLSTFNLSNFNLTSFCHVYFLVLLWPQWDQQIIILSGAEKGLSFSYLDSSNVMKVKIERCMWCFVLTTAWQGNRVTTPCNTLKYHHKVQEYKGYCGLVRVKCKVVL